MNENNFLPSRVYKLLSRSDGTLSIKDLKDAYKYFNGLCPYCGEIIDDEVCCYDHVIPIKMGGETKKYNIIPTCIHCNPSKYDLHLLDWWDKKDNKQIEYRLENIFIYILNSLDKKDNEIFTKEKEELDFFEDDIYEEEENDDINPLVNNLDVFTFLYQILNHMNENKEYLKNDINVYVKMLQQAYDENLHYERIDTDLFLLQSQLIKYLKDIGVINHYNIAISLSSRVENINQVIDNVDSIKKYLRTNSISHLINKNPYIILMDSVEFSSKLEYMINVLNIPLKIILQRPMLINEIGELRELIEWCKINKFELKDIPNWILSHKKISKIREILNLCKEKNVSLKSEMFNKNYNELKNIIDICKEKNVPNYAMVYRRTSEELEKIIKLCEKNNIEITGNGNIFMKSPEELEKIIEMCKENNMEIASSMFIKPISEIKEIINECKKNNIEITGSVFLKSFEEIKDIADVCKKNNIELKGNIFKRNSKEIEEIIDICKKYNVEVTGSVFQKNSVELEKIIKLCKQNNIEITGGIFLKTAEELEKSIKYLKTNYGDEYLKPLLINKSETKLKEILPYLKLLGVLRVVINSASILTLSLDEIKERKDFLDYVGEPMVVNNKFNSIFGLTKKKFKQKQQDKKNYNYKKSL